MEEGEGKQIIYQTAVLNPQLVEAMVYDDSPPALTDEFWQFLGIDIPVADIKPWDFKNILDMVDLAFAYQLYQYPEEKWDKIMIVEMVKDPETGEKKISRVWQLTKVWNDIRTKVYLKMCRARNGFTLDSLTKSKQELIEHSNVPFMPTGMPQINTQEKKGWKVV